MTPENAADTARLLDWDPDVVVISSPNAALPGPKRAREMVKEKGKPCIVISDAPAKKAVNELKEQGFGYIIIPGDPMIGARREFLDPVEMSLFNADVLSVLTITGVARLVQEEFDAIIETIKKGGAVKVPQIIATAEKAVERAKKKRHAGQNHAHGQRPLEVLPRPAEQAPVYTKTKVISLDRDHLESQRLMTFLDDPEAMDCYSLLRTQLLQRTRDKGHNTIMITSVVEGEGKTITAINLAVSIAREVKQTLLLVDTDLRNPKIHHYMGCDGEKGLCDYLLGDVPLEELLFNPGLAKMVVLPAGKRSSGSTEILGSPKMEKLVEEMKTRYPERYVIFDCPPLLTVPDALVFSSYVDGVILVVEAGKTPRDQIQKAIELLDGRNIIGLVMNASKEPRQAYYY